MAYKLGIVSFLVDFILKSIFRFRENLSERYRDVLYTLRLSSFHEDSPCNTNTTQSVFFHSN